jgi:HEPN domain-containing protein
MRPDEARAADTAAWLARAATDLRSAQHALIAREPLREDAVFHCQQAIEKAFKGFLTWHDVPFRKTHSLEELGRQCAAIELSLGALVDAAAPLSEYAWRYRYPGPGEPPTPEEAEEAIRIAHAALEQIGACLPGRFRASTE